jgi:phosphoribosylaminoimidazole-succinocarboxamide synthase
MEPINQPPDSEESELSGRLKSLKMIHRGKVRDTYWLPSHPEMLLMRASDRISIFDFVLGPTVPFKGEVLVALTVFWLTEIFRDIDHHLVAFGSEIDKFVPKILVGNSELHRCGFVVEKLEMLRVECIARGYLTGSGWRAYQKDKAVCGISLPEGLHDGSKLPEPIFTPTTKAQEGHDEHISAESVDKEYGTWLGHITLELYERAFAYALSRGVIIADTKFEFGSDKLGDEVLTPDSSRFWDVDEYEKAQEKGQSPQGYDKEPVRQAGTRAEIDGRIVDISKLDPTNEDHVRLVKRWNVPKEVVEKTTFRYLTILERLTGMGLKKFQTEVMKA